MTFDTNIWHHLVGVREGENVKLYRDGVQIDSVSGSIGDTSTASQNFYIGRSWAAESFFAGSIDDVRAYGRALSATEVLQLYNMGR